VNGNIRDSTRGQCWADASEFKSIKGGRL